MSVIYAKPESYSKDSPQILERYFVFIGKVERQLNAKLECDSIDQHGHIQEYCTVKTQDSTEPSRQRVAMADTS